LKAKNRSKLSRLAASFGLLRHQSFQMKGIGFHSPTSTTYARLSKDSLRLRVMPRGMGAFRTCHLGRETIANLALARDGESLTFLYVLAPPSLWLGLFAAADD
jgi:hypothetical protein